MVKLLYYASVSRGNIGTVENKNPSITISKKIVFLIWKKKTCRGMIKLPAMKNLSP